MASPNTKDLIQILRNAGVVGAGGAGFPTYRKIDTAANLVIANGAECEPLLYKDQILMDHYPAEIVGGLVSLMRHVGANRGIVAIKARHRRTIESFLPHLPDDVSVFEMDDVYPAGDEYEVVYHSTGRRIPAGGYPSDIGVVVQNVETLYNVHRATHGLPVTHSMMTVHGNVRRPLTVWLPVGMSYGDVLDLAGGPTIENFVLLDGGPMMGRVTADLSTPVTRVSSGIIVVPRDSNLAVRRAQTDKALKRFGKSACDQCCLCTEMCPRYLLGYPIRPHLVMRSLLVSDEYSKTLTHWAQACSECNICSLWACPEGLDPRGVCAATKTELRGNDSWLSPDELRRRMSDVHPLKAHRCVPTARLARRLGLHKFVEDAPLLTCEIAPKSVAIPLRQHAGAPALPVVTAGDRVKTGDVIARAAESGIGVPIHASIDGIVRSVEDRIVIER